MVLLSPHKRVIVLALDGVGRFFTDIQTPAFDAFFASGASSLTAKAIIPTDSAQNWGSILHGVLPEKHGLKNGDVEAGVPYDENSPYPSIYKLLANDSQSIKMASYVAWEPINTGIIERSVKVDLYAPLTHESVLRRWWLRFKHNWLHDSAYDYIVVSRLADYIRNPENKNVELLFIHLTDVDEHGHSYGYGSQQHLNQIKVLDSQVATILETIDEVGWKDDSLVIMTTDHGGIGRRHGGSSDQEVDVFLAIRGKGIEPNFKIESEVTNMDCAALILKGLGREVPGWFDAKLPAEFSSMMPTDHTERSSENYGLCPACGGPKTYNDWCPTCFPKLFLEEYSGLMSGDKDVDDFIAETIITARRSFDYIEFIPYKNFKDIKEIGKGGFATVYSATRTNCLEGCYVWDEKVKKYIRKSASDYPVALKSFRNEPGVAATFFNEIKTHHRCMVSQKKNFLQCYGISRNPVTKEFIIVLDYARHGDLRSFLKKNNKTLKWGDRLGLVTKIAKDLEVIHDSGLIHCDFHSGNVLQVTQPKVSDFGLSRPDEDHVPKEGVYGVVPYMAPEVLSGKPYRKPADVYSFGIIMWEVSSGVPAFCNISHDYQLIFQICDGLRPQIVKGTPQYYVKLMERCWDKDPKKRPTATELYETCLKWYDCVKERKTESNIYKQFEEADKISREETPVTNNPNAIYSSRLIQYTSQFDSKQLGLSL